MVGKGNYAVAKRCCVNINRRGVLLYLKRDGGCNILRNFSVSALVRHVVMAAKDCNILLTLLQ